MSEAEPTLRSLLGKQVVRAQRSSNEIILSFDDGSIARISAEAGTGYNEGLAWIECKITAPNTEEELP